MASPHDLLIPYSRFVENTIFVNNSGKYEETKYVLQLISKANSLLYKISTPTSGSLRNYFIPRYENSISWLDFFVYSLKRIVTLSYTKFYKRLNEIYEKAKRYTIPSC